MKVAYGDRISFMPKTHVKRLFVKGQRSIYLEITNIVEKENE